MKNLRYSSLYQVIMKNEELLYTILRIVYESVRVLWILCNNPAKWSRLLNDVRWTMIYNMLVSNLFLVSSRNISELLNFCSFCLFLDKMKTKRFTMIFFWLEHFWISSRCQSSPNDMFAFIWFVGVHGGEYICYHFVLRIDK